VEWEVTLSALKTGKQWMWARESVNLQESTCKTAWGRLKLCPLSGANSNIDNNQVAQGSIL